MLGIRMYNVHCTKVNPDKQIRIKIQVVAHGWGGSTLSNGQVQVEDDMART